MDIELDEPTLDDRRIDIDDTISNIDSNIADDDDDGSNTDVTTDDGDHHFFGASHDRDHSLYKRFHTLLNRRRLEPVFERDDSEVVHTDEDGDSSRIYAKVAGSNEHARRRSIVGRKSPLSAQISAGILIGVYMFVFSSVFALIVFEPNELSEFVPIGVSIHLVSAWISCIAVNTWSGTRVAIASPDANVTVFLATAARDVLQSMSDDHSKVDALATVLFVISLGTLLTSCVLYVLGHFRWTKMVKFVPASVLHGFLGCVGYQILTEAISVSTGIHFPAHYKEVLFEWNGLKHLLPMLPFGIIMYLSKRHNWAPPTVIVPVALIGPPALFYIVLASGGYSVDDVRRDGWLVDRTDQAIFYDTWRALWERADRIEFAAVYSSLPDLFAMAVVVVLDLLLKLAGTEKELSVDLDMDDEIKLAGMHNFANWMGAGVPAYSQLEFTGMNFDIIHNTVETLPGRIAAGVCFLLYMWGVPVINVLPRFFLGGMIMYASIGFLVHNLYDCRSSLSRKELATVWLIVIINAVLGILIAIVVGIVLATGIFVYDYSRRIDIWTRSAARIRSNVLRPLKHTMKLQHLGELVYVIRLKGALFFGTASKLLEEVQDRLHQPVKHSFQKLRYIVLDFERVSSCDAMAITVLLKVRRLAKVHQISVFWCGFPVGSKVLHKLRAEGVLKIGEDFVESTQAQTLTHIVEKNAAPAPIEIQPTTTADMSVLTHEPILSRQNIALLRQETEKHLMLDISDLNDLPTRKVVRQVSARSLFEKKRKPLRDERFVLATMDYALDTIEEELLTYAAEIRSKWLVFPGMKKLNALSAFEAVKGPFDELLDTYGDIVWRYVGLQKCLKGAVLFHTGDPIEKLYILHHGRVSSYLEHDDGSCARVSCKTHGWVTFGLFDASAAETVVCDLNCTFVTITEQQMDELEHTHPKVAIAIHRAYFEDVSAARNRLERQMDQKQTYDGYSQWLAQRENDLYRRTSLLIRLTRCVENEIVVMSRRASVTKVRDSASVATAMYPTVTIGGGASSRRLAHPRASPNAKARERRQLRRPRTPPPRWETDVEPVSHADVRAHEKPAHARTRSSTVVRLAPMSGDPGTVSLPLVPSHQMRTSSGSYQAMLERRWKRKRAEENASKLSSEGGSGGMRSWMSKMRKLFKVAPSASSPTLSTKSLNKKSDASGSPKFQSKSTDSVNMSDTTSSPLMSRSTSGPSQTVSPLTLPVAERIKSTPVSVDDTNVKEAPRLRLHVSSHDLRKSVVLMRAHRLSNSQRQEYTNYFNVHAVRMPPNNLRKLPMELLRHALMDVGYYMTAHETVQVTREMRLDEAQYIELDTFLRLMGKISQCDLSARQVASFDKVFSLFANEDQLMTQKELMRLLTHTLKGDVHPRDVEALIDEWDADHQGSLSFQDFLSMMGFSLKRGEMDGRINTAWNKFAENREKIGPRDVQRVIYEAIGVEMSNEEAEEMVWEAKVNSAMDDHELAIGWSEFVIMMTNVYQPGWIVQYDWKHKRVRRFAHDLIVEGEFDDFEDVPELRAHYQSDHTIDGALSLPSFPALNSPRAGTRS